MRQKYIFFFSLLIIFHSCGEAEFEFPNEPDLKLVSVEQYKLNGKDSLVEVVLNYTDGDGNIGLEPADTLPPFQFGGPYFYNLIIHIYHVENGIEKPLYFPLTTDTINFNDRIKNLTPTGKHKSIQGELKLSLNAKPYFSLSPDSMLYKITL